MQDSIKCCDAVINEELCIHCNLCQNICQRISPPSLKKPLAWFQGWDKDESSRQKSSSGGFANALMKEFVLEGGEVCSCLFSEGRFQYQFVERIDELDRFRGSKYVKSDPQQIYSSIKSRLESRKILFLGLPCHVAALRNYVGKKHEDSLYTVDLICHGTPSALILSQYLMEYGINIDTIKSIAFRDKSKFRVVVEIEDNRKIELTPRNVRDRYTVAFLNGLFYTENCYSCKYAGIERVSDITLGDSWGNEFENSSEGKKGISLALCQTEKGLALLKRSGIELLPVDLDKAVKANHQLRESSARPSCRESFFQQLDKGKKIRTCIMKCYPEICFRQDVKAILTRLNVIKG